MFYVLYCRDSLSFNWVTQLSLLWYNSLFVVILPQFKSFHATFILIFLCLVFIVMILYKQRKIKIELIRKRKKQKFSLCSGFSYCCKLFCLNAHCCQNCEKFLGSHAFEFNQWVSAFIFSHLDNSFLKPIYQYSTILLFWYIQF